MFVNWKWKAISAIVTNNWKINIPYLCIYLFPTGSLFKVKIKFKNHNQIIQAKTMK